MARDYATHTGMLITAANTARIDVIIVGVGVVAGADVGMGVVCSTVYTRNPNGPSSGPCHGTNRQSRQGWERGAGGGGGGGFMDCL